MFDKKGILLRKPALISPNEMSPKSPTNIKEPESEKDRLVQNNSKKAERPTSLAKRDIIVEISGKEKTKTRTTECKQDKPNMCQVQDNMAKGRDFFFMASERLMGEVYI